MKRFPKGRLGSLLFCFLAMAATCFGASKKSAPKSTFDNPNFAFPQTVRADALPVYEKAMKNGEPLLALKAAMELNVADRITTTDSVRVSMERYRRIADRFGDPYSSMARLLEARLLAGVYAMTPWKYNQRVLPVHELDPEPMLWSGDQFRAEVGRLCRSVLAESATLSATGIKSIAMIVTGADEGEKIGFSLLDFATYRIISITEQVGMRDENCGSKLPFRELTPRNTESGESLEGDNAGETPVATPVLSIAPLSLMDSLIAYDSRRVASGESAAAGALFEARLHKAMYADAEGNGEIASDDIAAPYVVSLLNEYPAGSEKRFELVSRLYSMGLLKGDNSVRRKKLYELLTNTLKDRKGDSEKKNRSILDYAVDNMMLPSYSINGEGQWLPGEPGVLKYKFSNVKNAFILLVPVTAAFAESDNPRNHNIVPAGKIRTILHEQRVVEMPVEISDSVSVEGLEPGYYAVVVSESTDLGGIPSALRKQNATILNVSGISMFSSDGNPIAGTKRGSSSQLEKYIYVVDARNNAPLKDVNVTFADKSYRGTAVSHATTDADGRVRVPYDNFRAVASRKGSRAVWRAGRGYGYNNDESGVRADILTDLSIYHPGDTVSAAVILTRLSDNRLSPASGESAIVSLLDANGKRAAIDTVTTDDYGRSEVRLPIPAGGLTGRFLLVADRRKQGGDAVRVGSRSIQVAEYKAPTFKVTVDSPVVESSGDENEVIELSGNVMTYSGMPLEGSAVNLVLNFEPWWRPWWSPSVSGGEYGVKSVTDANGRFLVRLAIERKDAEKYAFGSFLVKADATSPAGETCSAYPERFSLGEGCRIERSVPDMMEVKTDTVTLGIRVTDILSRPVNRKLSYSLRRLEYDSDRVEGNGIDGVKGEFLSPSLKIPAGDLPSGMYRLVAVLPESYKDEKGKWMADTLECNVTLWRKNDVRPPHAVVLWAPEREYFASPGAESVDVNVGSGFDDEYLYCEISDRDKVLKREWLRAGGKNITVKVDAPEGNDFRKVRFFGMHDLNREQASIDVYSADKARKTRFETVTFRDRLVPGKKESWKFRLLSGWDDIEGGMKPQSGAAALAVLSNEALNAIAPFKWSFRPASMLSFNGYGSIQYPYLNDIYSSGNLSAGRVAGYTSVRTDLPEFNFWGYSQTFPQIMVRGTVKYRATAKSMESKIEEDAVYELSEVQVMNAANVVDQAYLTGSVESVEDADAGEGTEKSAEPVMRKMDMPLAFFRPMLTAGEDGVVEIDFDVPDYNTTWVLQLIGYNKNMESAMFSAPAVASKPVMVQTLMPRFLLTGDKAEISATVFNNSENHETVDARIEIFDISSGRIIAVGKYQAMALDAGASGIVTVSVDVPYNVTALGVRSVAECSAGSDGEQASVQVLPSSMPVSDAETFYLAPGEERFELTLPKMNEDGFVTLNYCDNPSWYILTALSGLLTPGSDSALESVVALYSNCVASGMIERYPDLRKGLENLFSSDGSGTFRLSPLDKNQSLKPVTLHNTPWVNNASAESERIESLVTLLDEKEVIRSFNRCVDKLSSTRNPDGSWSWMKGMPGSEWITLQVVSALGELRSSGYMMPDSRLDKMLSGGIAFTDKEIGKDYYNTVEKNKGEYPLSSEIGYLYLRSKATDSAPSGNIAKMKRDLLRRLPAEWRELGIMDKATAAILLYKNGNKALAAEILESVRQMASYKDSKGMWFDSPAEGYLAPSPLLLTARCLDAFMVVDKESDSVEKLARYLVLSRQTQDWNLELGQAGVASVVDALLSATSAGGFVKSPSPRIFLDGKELILPSSAEMLTGNVYLSLDPKVASGARLLIERSGDSPAWGGIISQYVAPAAKVKAADVPQLSITKALLPVETGAGGKRASSASTRFSKGERIRVSLTVVCDRELDYLLISDRLGAWMQPDGQLTQYMAQDGLWMLRETRSSAMNFYIMRLPKGKNVISYEVNADRDGEYSTGIATAASLYYPLITAHSAGAVVSVE